MKLKNIAKASLALWILTTGMITTTAQPVKASTLEVKSQVTQDLSEYYNRPYFDLRNLSGYREGNTVTFINHYQQTDVKLQGKGKDKIKDGNNENLDVFVVREGSGRQADNNSIGGITKTNGTQHIDTVQNVNLLVSKSTGQHTTSVTSTNYSIYKEEISLKELDFKLRKHLIDNHDLYKTEPKDSKIRINMKDGGYYTFELNKKLQTHRMGDVIDGTKIKEINVELN
ncbi:TPA: superantigen-like protein SSL11 [Staphylococcus aureus]|nr:superantigen-like protein SSL11 [Staphylococcus aureus]MCW8324511.1 superantigen-like protein SSL11 [Staphylococcus aureus]